MSLTMTLETMQQKHYPVMYREVLKLLELPSKAVVVDCTLGTGAHAKKFLEQMPSSGRLIGIDKDQESLQLVQEELKNYEGRFYLVREDFSHLDEVLKKLKISKADAFFFDLGISTRQLLDPERGFSFLKSGPLDMRMDRNSFLCASDLVNNLSEGELENIFRKFGEERYARKIAHELVALRKLQAISTTEQLTQAILRCVPSKALHQRIHPATRVFQALRIAVNRELEVLKTGIEKALSYLNPHGRIAVISFHSLEDRIVKHTFRDFEGQGALGIITKKPLEAGDDELSENAASRSAKLRVAERLN
jgi:16S rRNA (cytosine1402-N4)-methyltransferase